MQTYAATGALGTRPTTAVTAQNTLGVRAIHDVPPAIVRAQLDAIFDDFDVAAVKVGMLSSAEIIVLVAEALAERASGVPVIVDPVMIATSGERLLEEDAVGALVRHLVPLATLATPNVDEAAVLASTSVRDVAGMRAAARAIIALGASAVLVKGGHLPATSAPDGGSVLFDLLVDAHGEELLPTRFVATASTHGTGCTLSSAIAARLALGDTLFDAVVLAQQYVHGAIASAEGHGHGHGPLKHRWLAENPDVREA
jgi:hydroxymethylpyrimidine/phosphomethylpyrimidine kinase